MREGCVKVLSKRLQGAAEERGAGPQGSVSRNGIPESSLDEDPRRNPLHGKRLSPLIERLPLQSQAIFTGA